MLSYGPRGGQSMMCVCVCACVFPGMLLLYCQFICYQCHAEKKPLWIRYFGDGIAQWMKIWRYFSSFESPSFFFLKTTEWNAAQNHERASAMCYRWAYKLTGLYCRRLLTEIRIHDPIRPVGTDFQSTSCVFGIPSLLSLLAFLKNGFLTTIFP